MYFSKMTVIDTALNSYANVLENQLHLAVTSGEVSGSVTIFAVT